MGPVRVALLGILAYILLFCVAPVTVVTPQTLTPYLYIAFCYLGFFCGCIIAQGPRKRGLRSDSSASLELSDEHLMKLHRIVIAAATLGAILKVIDTFFIRHVSLASTAVDRVSEIDSVGPNPVSIVCAVLVPACLLAPFTYLLLKRHNLATRTHSIVAHVLFLIPVLGSIAIGGKRSMALLYIIIYVLYRVYFGRFRLTTGTIIKALAGLIAILAGSTAIFNNRLQEMNLNPLDTVYTSAFAFTLQPQAWISQIMLHDPGLIGNIAFSVLMTCQYYLHGVFEFVYQYQNAPSMHIWGAASFNAYYKFLAVIMNWTRPSELWEAVSVRIGVFTTFFGPVFSDFGWFGVFYMTGMGILAQRLWERSRSGFIGAVPFYIYLVYTIFLFPVGNNVTNAQGLYSISVFALFFWLVASHTRTRRRAIS